MSALFSPFTLKGVTLRNRIVASPMCQYSAVDGHLNDWHFAHYASLARGGVGLVIVEATAISPQGRITPGDAGLWDDSHINGFMKVVHAIKDAGAVAGIQIGHAGRKAGCTPPWLGGTPLPSDDPRAWTPEAPSSLPYSTQQPHVPKVMTMEDIAHAQSDFVAAAKRALHAGFEWLELHFAHGFLGQTFLSRKTNERTDAYGGSLTNRARFLVETVAAVRAVWPHNLPLTVRLGMREFGKGEQASFEDALQTLKWLQAEGLDLVDVGLAGTIPGEDVPWGPNFMVEHADMVKQSTGLPVATSWMITQPHDADAFVRDGRLDLVMLARTLLANPHWPYEAARQLGAPNPQEVLPVPYAYWLQGWEAEFSK
ncbi:NADH:flavin oxidoreductase/NADH oxidase [Xanthomonas arboricola]|uniref:NADH:flavin oxidoreductase/NADH oxidase n=2 Tax=Xanthomonas arboricola TaxID=56448 RepID=UPI000CEDEB78|nr:NADH:flavin oxidoreductase/NADH oxidase [Xanthomonas arboricola]MBB6575407.1 2,4-dienoyl-CoA reductase-like NADH-dependent reductase (Old Yellow Enzyme family) [Xanthomonas arboricola]PPT86623.1 NADH:flavin oxidoreductase [Xanthomonas arboricola]PPU10241.1 NADH:flavin oxidoreductase [Xanthomonas arboricola]PPU44937.1 NADH:flavin oxidoreductase [Xanthomonas arboricola]